MAQRGSRNDHRARRGAGKRGNKHRKLARRIAKNRCTLQRQVAPQISSPDILLEVNAFLMLYEAGMVGEDDFDIFDQLDPDFF